MNEELAHIAVSPLTDAEKLLLSAGRVLPRHEAEPRRQIAGFVELLSTTNRGQKCGGSQGSDTGNRHEPSRHVLSAGYRFDLACDVAYALL